MLKITYKNQLPFDFSRHKTIGGDFPGYSELISEPADKLRKVLGEETLIVDNSSWMGKIGTHMNDLFGNIWHNEEHNLWVSIAIRTHIQLFGAGYRPNYQFNVDWGREPPLLREVDWRKPEEAGESSDYWAINPRASAFKGFRLMVRSLSEHESLSIEATLSTR
jgi:hypothetical protein